MNYPVTTEKSKVLCKYLCIMQDFVLSLSMVRVASKPADWPRVSGSHDLPIGFSTKNCQHNSIAVDSKNEDLG